MKKSRVTETQIVAILKEADAGMQVKEIGSSLNRVGNSYRMMPSG